MQRVSVYIDGFNFYYSLKRARKNDPDFQKFYWLDFVKFFDHFMQPGQTLQKVYYFSAPDMDLHRAGRQNMLFLANKLINGNRFEVVYGKYYDKQHLCQNCKTYYRKPEEKRTDVNISAYMLRDCAKSDVDTVILVSADSDLITPLEFIKADYPNINIKVFFPPNSFSKEISATVKGFKQKITLLKKHKTRFNNSIMTDTVTANGTSYTIPAKWKQPPTPADPSQTQTAQSMTTPPAAPTPPPVKIKFYIQSRFFKMHPTVMVDWSSPFIPRIGEDVSPWIYLNSPHLKLHLFKDDLSEDGKKFIAKCPDIPDCPEDEKWLNWLYELLCEADLYIKHISYYHDKDSQDIIIHIGLFDDDD